MSDLSWVKIFWSSFGAVFSSPPSHCFALPTFAPLNIPSPTLSTFHQPKEHWKNTERAPVNSNLSERSPLDRRRLFWLSFSFAIALFPSGGFIIVKSSSRLLHEWMSGFHSQRTQTFELFFPLAYLAHSTHWLLKEFASASSTRRALRCCQRSWKFERMRWNLFFNIQQRGRSRNFLVRCYQVFIAEFSIFRKHFFLLFFH